MTDLPDILLLVATIFFFVAGAYTARSRAFDFHNFGLALMALALLLVL